MKVDITPRGCTKQMAKTEVKFNINKLTANSKEKIINKRL